MTSIDPAVKSRSALAAIRSASASGTTLALLLGGVAVAFAAPLLAAQEKEDSPEVSSVYPTAPATAPPATKVENSEPGAGGELKPYDELITGTTVTFAMTPIPEGTFLLGSPAGEADRKDWEGPQIPVKVSAFWMGTHEVRWDEYSVFMDSLDKRRRANSDAKPTTQDSWADPHHAVV